MSLVVLSKPKVANSNLVASTQIPAVEGISELEASISFWPTLTTPLSQQGGPG
jgi:hypothetical protein